MHYIGDAYYLYIFKMKSILTSIAFIILAFSIAAQPQPSMDCGPSTWDGLGLNPTLDAHAFFCNTHSAPVGTYIYWNPFQHSPTTTQYGGSQEDFAEWNWDNIYGMKGRFGINFPNYLGAGDTLSAQVFETKFNPTNDPNGDFQTNADNVFDFYGGNYKFNMMHIAYGTIVKVHPGAYIEIHTALTSDYASVLEIMPGATVLLKSSRDNIAVTNVNGAIEGTLKKEMYFDVSDAWSNVASNLSEMRFVFNPGMYDVDLHQVALDIQDAASVELSNSIQEPSVQIGYWGKRPSYFDNESLYDFAAIHTYEYGGSPIQLNADSNLFVGEAALNADGFAISTIPGQSFALRTNSIAGNFYNWNEGVSILPIYPPTSSLGTSDATLLEYWFSDDDIIGFANEEITTNSDISSFAKTPISLNRTFTISLLGANASLTDFEIVVEGKFDSGKYINIGNATVNESYLGVELTYPGATATYIGNPDLYPEISTYFENTAVLNAPESIIFGVDLYTRTGDDDVSLYRGIDWSGLSLLNNKTGNYLSTYQTLFSLFGAGPDAQLALFDIAPLIARQDLRKFNIDPDANKMYESTSGEAHPIPVANLLIWDDTAPQYPGIEITDFYNIEDMRIFYAIGDTIRPDEMLAYNYNNPLDPQDIEGLTFNNFATLEELDVNWYNKGGDPTNGSESLVDTVYANVTNPPVYRKTEQVYFNNKPMLESFRDVRVPTGSGNNGSGLYDWTIEELNDMNEFTLIRLAGIDLAGDTLTLGIVPLSTDPDYSASEIDLFESSVAVNPIMYLWNPTSSHVMSRKWGAYGRGINDFNDSLQLIIDFDALDYVTSGVNSFTKLFIDAPVKQVGSCGLSGNNLVVIPSDGSNNLYTWASGFEYEIPLTSTYNEPNASGSFGDYGNGHIVDLIFTPVQSDFNGDGCVTISDLLIILGNIGSNTIPGDFNSTAADLNCDGIVSTSDLLIFLGSYGSCAEDNYESGELQTVQEKRMLWYSGTDFNNDHITYDIIDDYPSFSQTQRDFFNVWPHPNQITVVDDLNMIIAKKYNMESPFENNGVTDYSIQLPSKRPTTAQLDTTSAKFNVELPQTIPSYRIYVEWFDPVEFPGLPGKRFHICLGCQEDPNAEFPTSPIFVAN